MALVNASAILVTLLWVVVIIAIIARPGIVTATTGGLGNVISKAQAPLFKGQ